MAVKGLDQVLKNMRELTDKTRRSAVRRAVRKGAGVIRQKARANAQRVDDALTEESIAKNISVQFSAKQSRRSGNTVFRVGVLGGAKQYANTKHNVRKQLVGKSYKTAGDRKSPGGDTWYWRFLEFGTEKMRARPFLRPAASQSSSEVFDVVANELERQVAIEADKLRKG